MKVEKLFSIELRECFNSQYNTLALWAITVLQGFYWSMVYELLG